MLITIHRVMHYVQCYSRSEVLCSLLEKLYTHSYTWSEALRSLLYME